MRHLLDHYGSLIGDVLALATGTPGLLSPIKEAPGYLKVEAAYAAVAEGALHLEDILARRMRISIEYSHRGVDCAREVADLVAPILGWTAADIDHEVASSTARVEAEILSQTQPDDVSADELRASAPEATAGVTSRCHSIESRAAAGSERTGTRPSSVTWWTGASRAHRAVR